MKTPFVKCEGLYYVTIRCSGIHPLIPFVDGMAITTFPKDKKPYILLDDAIAWHENELERSHGESGNKKVMELLKKARGRFTADAQGESLLPQGENRE